MKQENWKHIPVVFIFVLLLSSCISDDFNLANEDQDESKPENESSVAEAETNNAATHESASDYSWSESDVFDVILTGNSVTENTDAVTTNGNMITINSSGNYRFEGYLTDGQIIIETDDEEIVRIILNDANITCSNSAPIYIKKADKVLIVAKDETQNTLTDGNSYNYDDDDEEEPNAAIFSKADLSFSGSGKLEINANFNDGISSKDGLIIANGNIYIDAVDDGIRGKDYLIIEQGTFEIESGGDGLKSDNDNDEEKGYIKILEGNFNINSKGDAIAAETDLLISYGEFEISTSGTSANNSDISSKGLKSGINTIVENGNFTINTTDDAIHSNQTITINNGNFIISTGDDGIHADYDLAINDGDIEITNSYEGIESSDGNMYLYGGNITLVSSDDGLNLAGGGDMMGGGPWGGGGSGSSSSNHTMYLKSNFISVNAKGDGIDANGAVEMQDGTVIINGPTSNGNGALDYDSGFKLSGGLLIAVGSSGMAQAPSSNSTQYSVIINFRSGKSANNLIHIESAEGEEIFTFKPAKSYQSVIFSSSKLEKGNSYKLYTGGSVTGESNNGLFLGQEYTAGTLISNFSISAITTGIQVN